MGAGAFSLFIIISSVIGPFVGGMVDRFGPQRVILLGSLILGTGLILCSLIQNWWQFYLFFSIITAIGSGASGWIPNITLIQRWFEEKRGLATGIVSAGIGVGILIYIPLIQYLIIQVGWRTTYRLMGLFIPLIVILIAVVFLRRPPQKISFSSTEMGISSKGVRDPWIVNKDWVSRPWTIQRSITTKIFWFLGLSFFLSSFASLSIFAHQVAFFIDRGLDPMFASYIVGMVGIMSIGGKVLWGVLSDRIGREVTYTFGIACLITGIVLLIAFSSTTSQSMLYFYSFFFGMGYAVVATLPPLIIADFFEGRAFGGIFGTLMIFVGVGGASGAWFAGFLYDRVGNYLHVFIILIACAILSCLNIWQAGPRKIRRVPGKKDRDHSDGY